MVVQKVTNTQTVRFSVMPKSKAEKKSAPQLRHSPLGQEMEKPVGKLKAPRRDRSGKSSAGDDDNDDVDMGNLESIPESIGKKIYVQAREQRMDEGQPSSGAGGRSIERGGIFLQQKHHGANNAESDEEFDDEVEEEEEENGDSEELIEFQGDYVGGAGLSEAEEAVVSRFLMAGRTETRTLADIIMDKIREKEEGAGEEDHDGPEGAPGTGGGGGDDDDNGTQSTSIPPKVIEVYTAVGTMLKHYKSGKLPKALKMLPHLKNWEDVLWITRPDEWSPPATYACTRIFASNLNVKMSQRFFNLVLLEKCRDDIRGNNKLNYHLYMALKKALFKPAAFYKGLLLPLAQSRTCSLREATIIGSVLAKVSIPGNHSAAALLRLAEMPYSGSTSLFIKVLINKKYALPRRVIESLVAHFYSFEQETRALPVIWHQALLVFSQRYKFELDEGQRERLKLLLRAQQHHTITMEIRRELFSTDAMAAANEMRY